MLSINPSVGRRLLSQRDPGKLASHRVAGPPPKNIIRPEGMADFSILSELENRGGSSAQTAGQYAAQRRQNLCDSGSFGPQQRPGLAHQGHERVEPGLATKKCRQAQGCVRWSRFSDHSLRHVPNQAPQPTVACTRHKCFMIFN